MSSGSSLSINDTSTVVCSPDSTVKEYEGTDDESMSSSYNTSMSSDESWLNPMQFSLGWNDVNSDLEYEENTILNHKYDGDCDVVIQSGNGMDGYTDEQEGSAVLVLPMEKWLPLRPNLPSMEFKGYQVLKRKLIGKESPIEYFNLVADSDILFKIVSATNKHAKRILSKDQSNLKRPFAWTELNVPELKTFIGLLTLAGSVYNISENWNPSRLLLRPIFPQSMPRDRFLCILKALSIVEEEGERTSEFRLKEIQCFVQLIAERMNEIYSPARELIIEDLRVFQTKHTNGIKLCTLSDSSGVVLNVHICINCPDSERLTHSDEVVMDFLKPYKNLGHSVFLSKNFTNVRLAKTLLNDKFYCTGEVSFKRSDNPKEVVNSTLAKGESEALYTLEGIGFMKHKQKTTELWLSSEYKHDIIVDQTRPETGPEMIVNYRENIKTGHSIWQLLHEPSIDIQTEGNCFAELSAKLFSLLLSNARSLHNLASGQCHRLFYSFKTDIVKSLLDPAVTGDKTKLQSQTSHSPHEIPDDGNCQYCYQNGWTQRTHYVCKMCPGMPHYCIKCFNPAHKYY